MSEEATIVKRTKSTNCAQCNKHIKRIKMYFRNGKYFCGKNCFKSYAAKLAEEKAAAAKKSAEEQS